VSDFAAVLNIQKHVKVYVGPGSSFFYIPDTVKGSSIADLNPGSGVFLALDPGSEIRDGKKSGSGMNIPDHFSESLGTVFRVKNTNSLIRIQDPEFLLTLL
jgi:hypothetical protein